MMWIEYSRDRVHGGPGWEFGTCAWAPTINRANRRWPYWISIGDVERGDMILHLQESREGTFFVGISEATDDGYITQSKPPYPGEWDDFSEFYRVDLKNFQPFQESIGLRDIFYIHDELLRNYYSKKSKSEHVFYVIQNSKLQILNGAYFSPITLDLYNILFENNIISRKTHFKLDKVIAGEKLSMVKQRIGHSEFSRKVKYNYNYKCCFPGCEINDERFLVGSHIERWADNVKKRGDISNGLCLCVFHDKALERGLYYITGNYKIKIIESKSYTYSNVYKILKPYENKTIRKGRVLPSVESLNRHYQRSIK